MYNHTYGRFVLEDTHVHVHVHVHVHCKYMYEYTITCCVHMPKDIHEVGDGIDSPLTLSLVTSVLLLNFFPFLLFQPKLNCGPSGEFAVMVTRVPLLDSKTNPCSDSFRTVTCCV